jgi:hypothetical protein
MWTVNGCWLNVNHSRERRYVWCAIERYHAMPCNGDGDGDGDGDENGNAQTIRQTR